jgi:hypothetical protein
VSAVGAAFKVGDLVKRTAESDWWPGKEGRAEVVNGGIYEITRIDLKHLYFKHSGIFGWHQDGFKHASDRGDVLRFKIGDRVRFKGGAETSTDGWIIQSAGTIIRTIQKKCGEKVYDYFMENSAYANDDEIELVSSHISNLVIDDISVAPGPQCPKGATFVVPNDVIVSESTPEAENHSNRDKASAIPYEPAVGLLAPHSGIRTCLYK